MRKQYFEITKAEIVKEPIILERSLDVERYKMKFDEVLDPYPDRWKLNFFEKMSVWINNGAKYSKIIFLIIDLIIKLGVKMEKKKTTNDQKTTNAGIIQVIVAAIAGLIALVWGKDIPTDIQAILVSVGVGIYTLAGFFVGLFSNKPDAK